MSEQPEQKQRVLTKKRKILIACAVVGIATLYLSSFFLTIYQKEQQFNKEESEYAQIKEFMYNRITIKMPDTAVHTFSTDEWSCKFQLIRDGGDLPVLKPMFDEFCDEKHQNMIKESYYEIFRENDKEELIQKNQL